MWVLVGIIVGIIIANEVVNAMRYDRKNKKDKK
jgi:hypothetical protein